MVPWKSYHVLICGAWARDTWRPRLSYICLLFRCLLFPWPYYYYLCWASVRKQVQLYQLLSFTVVCQHGLLASETSICLRLMASNAVNCHIRHATIIDAAADLRVLVVSCLELLGQYVYLRILSRLNLRSLSTRHLKTPFDTYVCSFVACFRPGCILTLWAERLFGSKLSSTSYCLSPLCASTDF